ncbi:hypothetical protein IWW47_002387, partial [Coemansia sp. RSA 2052]
WIRRIIFVVVDSDSASAQGGRYAAGQARAGNGECAGAHQQHQQAVLQAVYSQPRPVAEHQRASKPIAVHGQVSGQLGRSVAGVCIAGHAREKL